MSVTLYMDVHVPRAVTLGLRARGVDVVTAQEDGHAEADDEALLLRATALQRVLVTQDRDLLEIAARRQRERDRFFGVVFSPQSTATIGRMLADLELIAKAGEAVEFRDRVEFIPL